MAKEIFCAFGVDVDAVAGWLGSYGGEDSPCDITRGLFAGEIGSPRMLKLFDKYGIQTTWFIPGHSIETFPKQMKMVADAGHEIGLHGYSHENPVAMTPEQERSAMQQRYEQELFKRPVPKATTRSTTQPSTTQAAAPVDLQLQRAIDTIIALVVLTGDRQSVAGGAEDVKTIMPSLPVTTSPATTRATTAPATTTTPAD